MWAFGWYGLLRELMGVEELSMALHFDQALIDEVANFWSDFLIQMFDRAVTEVDVDYILFWEDLAFNTGPLLSPSHFQRFFQPQYKRVIDHFRSRGVELFMVDSDGNIDEIIPLWLDSGVNILGPFDVNAGMDIVKVRRTYGTNLAIVGGIDKIQLTRDRTDIEKEILKRVPPLLEKGGYIPTNDHCPIPEIPYSNYIYYREFLKKTCCE